MIKCINAYVRTEGALLLLVTLLGHAEVSDSVWSCLKSSL